MKKSSFIILKITIVVLSLVAFVFMLLSIFSINEIYKAYAETENEVMLEEEQEDEYKISPLALTASLSLSINCGDGKVWATVKNDYTIFPGTVIVIVQLYYSDYYAESYKDMILASVNTIADLNMGSTISTEASTDGVEKFWLARMRYKIDSNSWSSRQTGAIRVSAEGEF